MIKSIGMFCTLLISTLIFSSCSNNNSMKPEINLSSNAPTLSITGYIVKQTANKENKVLIVSSDQEIVNNKVFFPASWVKLSDDDFNKLTIGKKVLIDFTNAIGSSYPTQASGKVNKIINESTPTANLNKADVIAKVLTKNNEMGVPNPRSVAFDSINKTWMVEIIDELTGEKVNEIVKDVK